MNGIILIAFGNKQYLNMAVNMLHSIRHHSPSIKVALAVSTDLLTHQCSFFDEVIPINPKDLIDQNGVFQPALGKLNMDKFSPFSGKTLYLDVDGIALQPLEPLFELPNLSTHVVSLYPPNTDNWNCIWQKLESFRFTYQIPNEQPLTEINSSLILFDSKIESSVFFEQARKNFRPQSTSLWGGSFPDELAFNAAYAQLKMQSNELKPCYFEGDCFREAELIARGFYILGIWALRKSKNKRIYELYDRLAHTYTKAVNPSYQAHKTDQIMKGKHIALAKGRVMRDNLTREI